jgi:hypothetical protein
MIEMDDNEQNNDLFRIFLQIKQSSLSVAKKKQLIRPLFIGEEWSWVVTGISKKSIIAIHQNDFKYPSHTLCRHHFKKSEQTLSKLLDERSISFGDWSKIIAEGERVHIITNEEHALEDDYEYFPVENSEKLFGNKSRGFKYNKPEQDYIRRTLTSEMKPYKQKFYV